MGLCRTWGWLGRDVGLGGAACASRRLVWGSANSNDRLTRAIDT